MLPNKQTFKGVLVALSLAALALTGCAGAAHPKTSADEAPSFNPKTDPRYGNAGEIGKIPYRKGKFLKLEANIFPKKEKPAAPPQWVKSQSSCIGVPQGKSAEQLQPLVYLPTSSTDTLMLLDYDPVKQRAVLAQGQDLILWEVQSDTKKRIMTLDKEGYFDAVLSDKDMLIKEQWDCSGTGDCAKYRVSTYNFQDGKLVHLDDHLSRPDTEPDTPTPNSDDTLSAIGAKFYWLRGVDNPKHEFGIKDSSYTLSQLVEYDTKTKKQRIVGNNGAGSIISLGKYFLISTVISNKTGSQQYAILNPKDGSLHAVPKALNNAQVYTNIYRASVAEDGGSLWVDPTFSPENIIWYSFDGQSKPIKILNNHITQYPPYIKKHLLAVSTEDGVFLFDRENGKGVNIPNSGLITTNSPDYMVIRDYSHDPRTGPIPELKFWVLRELDGDSIANCAPAVGPSQAGLDDPKSYGQLPPPDLKELQDNLG